MTLNMVAEHTATHAKRDDGRLTQELAGDDPKTRHDQASSRTRTVWTTLVMCTSARLTSTSARKIR